MNRSLKLSRRPFIALGIVFGIVELCVFYGYIQSGFRPDFLLRLTFPILLYIAVMISICGTRIHVSSTGISVTTLFVSKRFISFGEIDHSTVQVLVEPDHPIWISIYGINRKKLIKFGLKSFDPKDVSWFCSLPEMKVTFHPGLTGKA